MTRVSFVIPNYNHAAYLGDAIRSALAQTHPDVEIVVVDDGSTDNSREVVQQFGAQLRLVCQENAGLSAARNTGIRAATGDYIALLDADDLVEPTYAERLLAALAASPGADGAYCGFRFVDEHNRNLSRIERRTVAPDKLYAALLNGNYWVPESLMARRSCYLERGEFDTSLRASEDWDVWLRFARHYTLVGIDDVLIRYRIVSGSMSSNPRRMLDNRLAVLSKHLGGPPADPGTSAKHEAYARVYLRSAVEYSKAGESELAYQYLTNAVRLLPRVAFDRATYYELACSIQHRGIEGDIRQLDFAEAEALLQGLTARLAADATVQPALKSAQAAAMAPAMEARAQWALATLYYRTGMAASARRAALKACRLDTSLLRSRSFDAFLARALIGYGRFTARKPSAQPR